MLIWYPAILLKCLLEPRVLVGSLESFMCKIILSICISFISFSCLHALAKKSNITLNKSGERGHPCLVPDFWENAFSFSPFSIMLAVGL
jgi:hypothetical protein